MNKEIINILLEKLASDLEEVRFAMDQVEKKCDDYWYYNGQLITLLRYEKFLKGMLERGDL